MGGEFFHNLFSRAVWTRKNCRPPDPAETGSGRLKENRLRQLFSRSSVDQFQRELDLPGGAGGLVDESESRSQYHIRGQAEIDEVENIEKLRAELQRRRFRIPPLSHRGIFDQGDIQVMKVRPAERVAAQGSKPTQVGPRTAGQIDRDGKE